MGFCFCSLSSRRAFKTAVNPNLETTNWDWEIDPTGLRIGLRRIKKKSFHWYKEVIESNGQIL